MTILLSFMCVRLSAQTTGQQTQGIGVYPGSPKERFVPQVTWKPSADGLTNVALHRAAYASSSCDYNLTAHLVTDGICDTMPPSRLLVSTSQGRLPRREAEWAVDGGPYSRNVIMGDSVWLQYEWTGNMTLDVKQVEIDGLVAYDAEKATHGFKISCQVSHDGTHWTTVSTMEGEGLPGRAARYQVQSDPNKQTAKGRLPARVLEDVMSFATPLNTHYFRIVFDMAGAVHWDIHELRFKDAQGQTVDMLPSQHFCSMWMSDGGGEQWIYVDLGKSLPVEAIKLQWYQAPEKGQIELSNDAQHWVRVMSLVPGKSEYSLVKPSKARYVRLLLQQPGTSGTYALREMEVMSPEQVVYTSHPVAGLKGGRYELSGGEWRVQRGSLVGVSGEKIASAHYDDRHWIPATVPGTVLTSYMNVGAVPESNHADDIDQQSESFFRSNFWYRDEFDLPDNFTGQQMWLNFDGINWKARVYLNGHYIGKIDGAFIRGKFNVTKQLRRGKNYLAVEVECNKHFGAVKEKNQNDTQFNGGILGADNPTFHASIGWDWITTVRGREVGIWNEVYLTTSGMVSVSDPYVQTVLDENHQKTEVCPSVFVSNHDTCEVRGTLSGWIGKVKFEQRVTLPPLTEKEIVFDRHQYPQLVSKHFRLWWPNGYGIPYLYDAGFVFRSDNAKDDTSSVYYEAALRQMTYKSMKDTLRMYINGRRFIPLGGNWGFDEHNLNYRSREYDIAVSYHRDMNFTMIRDWVGQVADEDFYKACDRNGIMVWQDFWLANPSDGPDPYDERMFLNNAKDYVRRIRQHGCVAIYCGRNEGYPPERIDRKLREYVHELSPGLDYISSSADDGVSGHGPYAAMPEKSYFGLQSGKIHTERGMPDVMNIESLSRTLDADSLWSQSVQWGKHDYTLLGAQRAQQFNDRMNRAFGPAQSAEQFTRRAQLVNYNGYRAMFEATSRHRAGLLIWMSHPCWPTMVWQTYDYYFDPTAAYFGAKKACEKLHVQHNALSDSIEIVNHYAGEQTVKVKLTVYNLQGREVCQRHARLKSDDDSTKRWIKLSDILPEAPSNVYFLRLQWNNHGKTFDNTYILGREDGNYQALATLHPTKLSQHMKVKSDSLWEHGTITVVNEGKTPAPFIRLNLKGADGEQILPAIYSDNYITLMPGESRRIRIDWKKEDARGQKAHVELTTL